jgi:uncharacterized membrane protein
MQTEQSIRVESVGNDIATGSAQVARRWQFSLRGLLITATFISICAAMGTMLPALHFAVFVTVLILELLYWLTPRRSRRELLLILAVMWAMLAISVLVSGIKWGYVLTSNNRGSEAHVNILFSSMLAAFLCWLALRRWRRFNAYRANL